MRLVVKLGTSVVADDAGELRADVLAALCDDVAALHRGGDEVVIVTSGAIARGMRLLELPIRARAMEELQAAKLVPDRLEIEITESAFLDDSEVTRLWLDQLQDLGVRISLDDFGTGYSSLSYLHSFPLNKVKIDRSFLQGLQASSRSLSLLYGVARLSAELDLAVTVEGVETREQLALIARERSITEVQGFYIGSAVPAEEIRGLLFSPQSQMDRVA